MPQSGSVQNAVMIAVRFLQALAPVLYHSSAEVRLTGWAILLANVVPLLGVLFAGWDPAEILYLYWLESLIVGFFTLLGILGSGLACREKGPDRVVMFAMSLFTAFFFMIHYGGFNFGHGIFLVILDGFVQSVLRDSEVLFGGIESVVRGQGWMPVNLIGYVIERTHLQPEYWLAGRSIFPAVFFLVLSHGFRFLKQDVAGGMLARTMPMQYMFRPYGRIFFMHIFIIVGLMIFVTGVVWLGRWATIPLMLLWICMKLAADLKAESRRLVVS